MDLTTSSTTTINSNNGTEIILDNDDEQEQKKENYKLISPRKDEEEEMKKEEGEKKEIDSSNKNYHNISPLEDDEFKQQNESSSTQFTIHVEANVSQDQRACNALVLPSSHNHSHQSSQIQLLNQLMNATIVNQQQQLQPTHYFSAPPHPHQVAAFRWNPTGLIDPASTLTTTTTSGSHLHSQPIHSLHNQTNSFVQYHLIPPPSSSPSSSMGVIQQQQQSHLPNVNTSTSGSTSGSTSSIASSNETILHSNNKNVNNEKNNHIKNQRHFVYGPANEEHQNNDIYGSRRRQVDVKVVDLILIE